MAKCMNCGRIKEEDDLHDVSFMMLGIPRKVKVCDVCGMMMAATNLKRIDNEVGSKR